MWRCVFTRYCRRDAFAHQPGKRQANGALDGGAGLCWYEDSKLQTRYLLVNLMAQPNRHNCQGNVYAKYWCARKQSARRCFAGNQTQQGEAQIWRREVSSRYGPVSESAGGATRSINVGLFFPVSLAMQNKTMLFSLDDTLVKTPCKH